MGAGLWVLILLSITIPIFAISAINIDRSLAHIANKMEIK